MEGGLFSRACDLFNPEPGFRLRVHWETIRSFRELPLSADEKICAACAAWSILDLFVYWNFRTVESYGQQYPATGTNGLFRIAGG
jgi:hypothetical protein